MSKTLETKKKILNLLKKKDMTISGLSQELGLSTATVSQHLDELQSMGAVEKIDNEHFKKLKYYKATQQASPMVLKYVIGVIAILAVASIIFFTTRPMPFGPDAITVTTANTMISQASNNTQPNTTIPGGGGAFACPMMFYHMQGNITNYSGFAHYTVNASNGFKYDDYVISNGSSGTISANEVVTNVLNESAGFNATRQHYVSILGADHPYGFSISAINYTISPATYVPADNETLTLIVTFNVSKNATGSYWARIDGPCAGGVSPFLITVGTAPDLNVSGPGVVPYA